MILEELTVEKKIEYSKTEGRIEEKLESMKKMIEKGFESDLITELLRIDENTYNEYVQELLERGEINEEQIQVIKQ